MKRNIIPLITAITFLIFSSCYVTGQENQWLKTIKSDNAWVTDMQSNNLGTIYLAGGFEGKIGMETKNLKSTNSKGIYLAKFTDEGEKRWIKTFNGAGKDRIKAVDTDEKGNAYMAINFIGAFEVEGQEYLSTSGSNILLMKVTPKGKIAWVKHIEGISNDYATDIAISHEDNFYLAGKFAKKMDFGNETVIKSEGNLDPFIAKFNKNCEIIWAKNLKSGSEAEINSITVDLKNNLVIAGKFKDKVYYDNKTTVSEKDIGLFLAKVSPDGKAIWLSKAGKCTNDLPVQVVTDKLGNIIVGGSIYCETPFPETALKTFNSNDVFYKNDMMVAKLNTEGELKWSKEIKGNGNEKVIDIDVDAENNVYFLGEHTNSINIEDSKVILEAPKPYNFLLGKLNPEGKIQWIERAGGNDDPKEYYIDVDLSSNIFLAGDFKGQEILRDFEVHTVNNEQESFLWKLADKQVN